LNLWSNSWRLQSQRFAGPGRARCPKDVHILIPRTFMIKGTSGCRWNESCSSVELAMVGQPGLSRRATCHLEGPYAQGREAGELTDAGFADEGEATKGCRWPLEIGVRVSLTASRRSQPCGHFDFGPGGTRSDFSL
jgi:hypothetical protein